MDTKIKMDTVSLIASIRERKGTEFATITTATDARLKKTGNPFGAVTKISVMNVVIGFNYENSVNLQRGREEIESEFKSAPRKWGQRVDLKTVEHKGETYLTIKAQSVSSVKYQTATGKALTKEEVEPFLPAKSKSTRQKTDKEIIYRDVKMSNVKQINFRGTSVEMF